MELSKLLRDQAWEASNLSYDSLTLEVMLQPKASKYIGRLFRFYRKSLAMNTLFLLATIALYWANPTEDMLLPLGLIGGCFLYLMATSWRMIREKDNLDLSGDLRSIVQRVLEFNQYQHRQMCRYHSVLFTICFAGGFILGMLLKGRQLAYFVEKPILFVILIILTTGFYFLTKTKSFRSLNRRLNPVYNRTKKQLETILEELETA